MTTDRVYVDQAQRDVLLAYLDQMAERAFLTYFCAQTELHGDWSHIIDPLYKTWQEIEHAATMVRCIR